MSKLSENLRRLRKQKGVYLKEVAPLLNVSIGTMSNYETDIHVPSLDTLAALADYYEVSVDHLIGHTDCTCPISAINREIYDGYTVTRFRELLDRLDADDLQHLVYMLKMFESQASARASAKTSTRMKKRSRS